MQKGFSLIELSVVLVILGLLVGGVIGGQQLIRAAELRKLSKDFENYSSAIIQYKYKYQAIPGDDLNATRIWGAATSNGNGDFMIGDHWTSDDEDVLAMQHLALAGFINHNPTTVLWPQEVGVNLPAGTFNQQGYRLQSFPWDGACCTLYGQRGFGIIAGRVETSDLWDGFLIPQDAWNIDSKFDDGKPASGTWMNQNRTGEVCNIGSAGDLNTATIGSNTYDLAGTRATCNIIYLFD